jgi:hypothetical protein
MENLPLEILKLPALMVKVLQQLVKPLPNVPLHVLLILKLAKVLPQLMQFHAMQDSI